jgi:uncharacterized protein YicC (UPF0701 family)
MTGFGHGEADGIAIEVRSTNARGMELRLQHPWGGHLDEALRRQVEAVARRGRALPRS